MCLAPIETPHSGTYISIMTLIAALHNAIKCNTLHSRGRCIWRHSLSTIPHCVLLEHYYSVDFPWWFDRKISFFSILNKTNEKLVKWQEFKAAFCDLTRKLLPSNFDRVQSGLRFDTNLQIDLEAKRMDGSSWNKNSIISVFTLFFAG